MLILDDKDNGVIIYRWYIENLVLGESTEKMIKLSGNVAGYKISIPKSIAFLLANQNNQLENIFEKWYLHNNIKKCKINVTKALQDLYEDKFKSKQRIYWRFN